MRSLLAFALAGLYLVTSLAAAARDIRQEQIRFRKGESGTTDSNANPTGGMRQLQYKLVPGEASWLLELDKVVEY
jgi:hypothetical protein